MFKKKYLALEEENKKLKNELRALNREIARRDRTIFAMESNFNIKMNMFRALAAENEKHQRYLTHMMKSSADFIILLDRKLDVAYCSDAFLSKIGFKSLSEAEGKDIIELYYRLNNDKLLSILKENLYLVITGNKTVRHDIVYDIEGKGITRTFRITNTPMFNEETGETSGIIIIWSDTADILNSMPEPEKPVVEAKRKKEFKPDKISDIPPIPGIDIQKGVDMYGGSIDRYLMNLSIFYNDIEKRLPVFKLIPSVDDLSFYSIEFDAITSSASSVGALSLSEEAFRLKIASEKGNLPFIHEKIPVFAKHLEELLDRIKEIV